LKRKIALVLAVSMAISTAAPATVFADEAAEDNGYEYENYLDNDEDEEDEDEDYEEEEVEDEDYEVDEDEDEDEDEADDEDAEEDEDGRRGRA
jgi:stringent starvation protein B